MGIKGHQGLSFKKLEPLIGEIGWVPPGRTLGEQTARIAVKVLGVNFAYGRWLFRVEPLAGTGTWQVDINRVDFRSDD